MHWRFCDMNMKQGASILKSPHRGRRQGLANKTKELPELDRAHLRVSCNRGSSQSLRRPHSAPPSPSFMRDVLLHPHAAYGRRLRVLCPGRPYSPRVSSHRSVHCHHPRCHRLHLPDDDPMPNNGGSNSIDTWLVVNGMCTGKVLTAPSQINLTAAFQRDSLSHITALEPQ
jgi:hypothetical protein